MHLNQNTNNINLIEFVNILFSKPPTKPCSYVINSKIIPTCLNTDTRQIMLPILMNILIIGARKLFGNQITPNDISESQFHTLQKYFQSFGFTIKYNYTISPDNIPIKVNIWFDTLNPKVTCNGILLY